MVLALYKGTDEGGDDLLAQVLFPVVGVLDQVLHLHLLDLHIST